LPGTVVLREDVDALVDAIAADMYIQACNCVRTFGDFQLALSGGSTPVALYQRLMIDPNLREFPWGRTHLWIVDERRVPFDDDRSNYKMINEIIGDHSGIPAEQVHPIFAMADDADARYTQALREVLGWRERGHDRLDYVLLGMGNDAHTASLFPHSPALIESMQAMKPRDKDTPFEVPLVRINAGPAVTPPDRVTMMLPLINAARFIGVMVTGSGKRETIRKVVAKAGDPAAASELPIVGVRPLGGELRWYLDYAACPDVSAKA
jgi:6-phosphogluconolactonase